MDEYKSSIFGGHKIFKNGEEMSTRNILKELSKQNKCTCPQLKCNYRVCKDNTCSHVEKVKFED
jgi:hypothetical protein